MEFSNGTTKHVQIRVDENLTLNDLVREVVAQVCVGNRVVSIDVGGGIMTVLLAGSVELEQCSQQLDSVISSMFGGSPTAASPRQFSSPRAMFSTGHFSTTIAIPSEFSSALRGHEILYVNMIREKYGVDAEINLQRGTLFIESDVKALVDEFTSCEDKFSIARVDKQIEVQGDKRVHIYIDLSNVQIGEIIIFRFWTLPIIQCRRCTVEPWIVGRIG